MKTTPTPKTGNDHDVSNPSRDHNLKCRMLRLGFASAMIFSPHLQAQFTYLNNNGSLTITYYTGPGGNVVIPSAIDGLPVVRIASEAFANRQNLTSVIIPDSITRIGYGAFRTCGNLTHVVLGAALTNIDEEAFYECRSLTTVTIPDGVTTIGPEAFWYCTNLTSVTIGRGLTTLQNSFLSCNNLSSFNVHPLNDAFSAEEGILFNKNRTLLVQFPTSRAGSYTIPSSVTSINAYAFAFCPHLTGVSLPSGLLNIGGSAFLSCTSLSSLILPDTVTSVGGSAFSNCRSLANVTLSENITVLSNSAFSGCSSLNSIVIPNTVTEIVDRAFSGCSSLKSAAIGAKVSKIGGSAFEGCVSLTSVILPDVLASIGIYAFHDCPALTGLNLPESLTTIGDHAFRGCKSLTTVTIPSKVTAIRSLTFADCTGLTGVVLHDMVATIDREAFSGCTNLTSVSIPRSVNFIGEFAFRGCAALNAITVEGPNTSFADVAGVLFNSAQTTLMLCPAQKAGNYLVPASVATIADAAFEGCAKLTSITIPSAVTSVGQATFRNCSQLASINVSPANPSLRSIDGVLFNNDVTLLLQYPCAKQGVATLPPTLTRLGPSDAFFACTGVTGFSVNPVSTVFSTADGVLFSKDGSVLVRFPPGRAGTYTLPNHVTTVDGYAFSSCAAITRLTVPASVVRIGYGSLAYCSGLNAVYCEGNRPDFSGSVFFDGNPNLVVYYLPSTTGWGSTVGYLPAVPAVLWNPQIQSPAMLNGRFGFAVKAHPGSVLVVEMSSDLLGATWLPAATLTLDPTGMALFSDPESDAVPARFYRFRWP